MVKVVNLIVVSTVTFSLTRNSILFTCIVILLTVDLKLTSLLFQKFFNTKFN